VKVWQLEDRDVREGWKRSTSQVRRYLDEHPDVLDEMARIYGSGDGWQGRLTGLASRHRLDYQAACRVALDEQTRRILDGDALLTASLTTLYRADNLRAFIALSTQRGLDSTAAMNDIGRRVLRGGGDTPAT
jgi:hypothetical protein